jgi:hypothetical protein
MIHTGVLVCLSASIWYVCHVTELHVAPSDLEQVALALICQLIACAALCHHQVLLIVFAVGYYKARTWWQANCGTSQYVAQCVSPRWFLLAI